MRGYYLLRMTIHQPLSTIHSVDSFVEKPDKPTAEAYLQSGDYLWNSGIFMFRASRYLQELERSQPTILRCCRRALAESSIDLDFIRIGENAFKQCPNDSIDYAVMEKASAVAVVPLDAGWSDIGSWDALWSVGEQDEQGNQLLGDVVVSNVKNSYVASESRLVAVLGLGNQIIVETPDAVLVANKTHAQEVKNIVAQLKQAGREELVVHKKVCRPWGSYQGVDQGERFQVKRLIVNPGAKLSLQLHHQRAEHWVVVCGTARVTVGDETFELKPDQSTYIPMGTKHQLENADDESLQIIEVQSGSYLGEDDIVRFEDQYGRVEETPAA